MFPCTDCSQTFWSIEGAEQHEDNAQGWHSIDWGDA